MPLRYVDEDEQTTLQSSRSSRRRPPWLALGLAVALAVVCLTWALTSTGHQPVSQATAQPSNAGGTSPAPDPQDTPTAAVDPTEPDPQATPLVATNGEVAGVPGLWQGTAHITTGNITTVWGVRVGWPQTIDGAVAAAFNGEGATYSLAGILPGYRTTVNKRVYTSPDKAPSTKWAASVRTNMHINDKGDVIRSGKVSPLERPYLESLIRFGAYRVMEVKEGTVEAPTWVVVEVWFPVIAGVGTDSNLTEVAVFWRHAAMDVVWEKNNWRLQAVARKTAVVPNDPRRTNQPYSNVRALLGPGWMVPADGTDAPYPGSILTKD